MFVLGWAVGRGSTPFDTWFTGAARGVVGDDPRWLLVFSSRWLATAVLAACAAVAAYRRRWRALAAVVLCPPLAVLAGAAAKRLFDRRNGPYLEYPSGHTTLLVVALGLAVVVIGPRLWLLGAAAAVTVAGVVGLVGCGYHYLTDGVGAVLLAGALVGFAAPLAGERPPVRAHRGAAALAVLGTAATVGAGVAQAAPDVPPVGDAARAAGFVDVRSAVPDAVVDLRYATSQNFTGTRLYPADARCLVDQDLAPGLAAAAAELRDRGRALVFWDCYRPHDAQVAMFAVVPDPNWVARPGRSARSHVAARSVDVTMTDPDPDCPAARRLGRICLADMGTDFDDFSPRARAFGTAGIGEVAVANRAVLRDAMAVGGFAAYPSEWWHFDGPGAGVDRAIVDVPVN